MSPVPFRGGVYRFVGCERGGDGTIGVGQSAPGSLLRRPLD